MSSQTKETSPAVVAPVTLASLTRRVLVLVHGPDLSMAPVLHALHLASKGAGQVMVAVKDPALTPAMTPFSRAGAAARWAAESDAARARAIEQLNEGLDVVEAGIASQCIDAEINQRTLS